MELSKQLQIEEALKANKSVLIRYEIDDWDNQNEPPADRLYKWELRTKAQPKKISGHRFVDLVSDYNDYKSELGLLLDFFYLKTVEDNVFMAMGRKLEEPMIKTQTNDYEMYEYEDCKGDMLNHPDFVGLIDAKDFKNKRYLEIKTYYSNKKKMAILGGEDEPKYMKQWWLQGAIYLWAVNEVDPQSYKKMDIVSCFISINRPEIINSNISVTSINYDDKFKASLDKLVEKASFERHRIVTSKVVIDKANYDMIKLLNKTRGDKLEVVYIDE